MANVSQRSFSAGEISPAMYARSDMERYATALRTLRNAVVLRTGGVQSRAGTEYLGSTKANGAARLVSAVFDAAANYVLEFGNLYVRFWKDGAPITATVTGAWANTTAYTAGIVVSYSGVNYVCLVAHTSVTATDRPSTGSSWQTKWYALTGTTYELPTPYTEAQLFDVQFAFQLDVVTVAHASHSIATLTRISNNVWDYAVVSLVEDAKVPQNVAVSGASGSGWGYTVAARFFADGVFTQGPANPVVRTDETATTLLAFGLSGDTRTITWNSVTDAVSYRVYLNSPGGTVWRYVNTPDNSTTFSSFSAAWLSAQEGEPTTATSNFDQPGEYPGVVAAYQQRLLVAGKTDFPDVVYASQVAEPYNFTVSSPIVDSDAMSWRQVGRRLNRVRHFVEAAQRLFQFSDVGESIVQGDTDGILRPGEVNPRQFSENGAAVRPAPLVVNDTALYVQARGSMVRDLAPIQVGGFAGSDLTLQAAHLVDGYELVDWCYQQTPHSVVWAVREDGVLLSLTYVRELGILGWAHHDTLGEIESVCCVPEGTVDAVYAVVKRTINAQTKRFVERFDDRLADSPLLADAAYVTSGPNTGTALEVSNGGVQVGPPDIATAVLQPVGGWIDASNLAVGYTLDLTYLGNPSTWTCTDASTFLFESTGANAEALAFAAMSPTTITIPVADWEMTSPWLKVISGLSYLEGESVSIVVDDVVTASPNNPAYTVRTVTGGKLTLSATPSLPDRVVVGLPYTTDIQTLDIDAVSTTVKERGMNIGGVIAWIEETGSFYAGPIVPTGDTLTGLERYTPQNSEGYDVTGPVTGVAEVTLQSTYNNSGRVLIRQVDPVPLTILSIAPTGFLNGGR